MNKFMEWSKSYEFFPKNKEVLKEGAKKILPWVFGGALAAGGVYLGYKTFSKSSNTVALPDNTSSEPSNDEYVDRDYWCVDLNVIEDNELKEKLKDTGCELN